MAGYYLTRHVVQPDIGLAAEAIAHHKDKKAQERDIEESMAPSQTLEDQNSDQELKESVSKQAAASGSSDPPHPYTEEPVRAL